MLVLFIASTFYHKLYLSNFLRMPIELRLRLLSSYWIISTTRLNPSRDLHLLPINQVVYLDPLSPEGEMKSILEEASHLDAFSAYPVQT